MTPLAGHTIDLDTDQDTGQRYELSFRYHSGRGDLLTAWTVDLAARSRSNGHIETLSGVGRSLLTHADADRPAIGLDADDLDTAYTSYTTRWSTLLTTGAGAQTDTERHHHLADALLLYWNAWRSGGPHQQLIIDRIGCFATITVLALDTDPALHVIRRAAAHHPRPVALAIYCPRERRLEVTLVDTGSIEALIADPAPLRVAPRTAGALLTGTRAAHLLHPGSIGAIIHGAPAPR